MFRGGSSLTNSHPLTIVRYHLMYTTISMDIPHPSQPPLSPPPALGHPHSLTTVGRVLFFTVTLSIQKHVGIIQKKKQTGPFASDHQTAEHSPRHSELWQSSWKGGIFARQHPSTWRASYSDVRHEKRKDSGAGSLRSGQTITGGSFLTDSSECLVNRVLEFG